MSYDLTCMDYSSTGNVIATGDANGKVKLWDAKSFLYYATFSEHTAKITAVKFTAKAPLTVISTSLDGTCRAYDAVRYRNFRVMKPDVPVQLTSLAIDPSGELVCAGGFDPYHIYVWNLQTGNLIDVIGGHEAPISCLAFSPTEVLRTVVAVLN